MPEIFGRHYDRSALEARVGELHQICGITPIVFDDAGALARRPIREVNWRSRPSPQPAA